MRDQVFISYSHADRMWLERLNIFLRPIVRENIIVSWDDTYLKPMEQWREEIRKALDRTRIAVLLISADFFASDFIQDIELPYILEFSKEPGIGILPIIIGESRFNRDSRLNRFQAVNDINRPLESLKKHESDYFLKKAADIIENSFIRLDKDNKVEKEEIILIKQYRPSIITTTDNEELSNAVKYGNREKGRKFEELFLELKEKRRLNEPYSFTVREIEQGPRFIAMKILEEAAEVAKASEQGDTEKVAMEISQLLYHVQVMLLVHGLELEDVYKHL